MVLGMKRFGKLLFAGLVVLSLTAVLLLPVLADTETVDGGDLLVFNDEVKVTESVDGDLLALAMELTVQGEVHGSIRACANEMLLDGVVDRNVTVVGTSTECSGQFSANDVKIVGDEVVFLGTCDTLYVYGGTVYIGGTVRGKLVCEAGQVVLLEGAGIASAEITSSSEPVVAGSLTDASYKPLKGSSFEGVVKFTKTQSAFVSSLIDLPFTLIAAVVLALVMTLVLKRLPERVPGQLKAHPFPFCLKGFGAIVAVPFAAIFLLIPVVTWPISLSILLLYVAWMLLADAVTAVVLSRVLMPRRNPYLSASLFAAIIAVLSILPFVGALVSLISASVGFGTVISLLWKRRDSMEDPRTEMDFTL